MPGILGDAVKHYNEVSTKTQGQFAVQGALSLADLAESDYFSLGPEACAAPAKRTSAVQRSTCKPALSLARIGIAGRPWLVQEVGMADLRDGPFDCHSRGR